MPVVKHGNKSALRIEYAAGKSTIVHSYLLNSIAVEILYIQIVRYGDLVTARTHEISNNRYVTCFLFQTQEAPKKNV